MKKKLLSVFAVFVMTLQLIACNSDTCRASDCDDEIYKDGYCRYHYYLNAGTDILKDIIN